MDGRIAERAFANLTSSKAREVLYSNIKDSGDNTSPTEINFDKLTLCLNFLNGGKNKIQINSEMSMSNNINQTSNLASLPLINGSNSSVIVLFQSQINARNIISVVAHESY